MQHEHVLKKLNFDLFAPTLRVRGPGWGGGGLGMCVQNICFHVAAFVIPFNFICNMIMFRKRLILTFCRWVGSVHESLLNFDLFT